MTVVGLGAWCDLKTEGEYRHELAAMGLPADEVQKAVEEFRRGAAFDIHEFAVLADGRRLTLHTERGFSTSVHGSESAASIERDVLTAVLPDDEDTEDEHPWVWLAGRLRVQGVEVSPDELKLVPYEVVLSDRLRARLNGA